jgi:hypothetical protein
MANYWKTAVSLGTIETPIKVLNNMAQELDSDTQGILKGIIRLEDSSNRSVFIYKFFIHCPIMRYSYNIFTLTHSIELYPAYLDSEEAIMKEIGIKPQTEGIENITIQGIKCNDKNELENILSRISSTGKVLKLIQSLISQASS